MVGGWALAFESDLATATAHTDTVTATAHTDITVTATVHTGITAIGDTGITVTAPIADTGRAVLIVDGAEYRVPKGCS